MFHLFRSIFTNKTKINLTLDNFNEVTFILNDDWNKIQNGDIWKCYFEKQKIINIDAKNIKNRYDVEKIAVESIGYISYRIQTGQIGLFFMDEKYKRLGLGKQILTRAINDINSNKITAIWAISTENHPFWSNVYDKSFEYKLRPHKSVTGSGYLLNSEKYNSTIRTKK